VLIQLECVANTVEEPRPCAPLLKPCRVPPQLPRLIRTSGPMVHRHELLNGKLLATLDQFSWPFKPVVNFPNCQYPAFAARSLGGIHLIWPAEPAVKIESSYPVATNASRLSYAREPYRGPRADPAAASVPKVSRPEVVSRLGAPPAPLAMGH
jgi:hypothetical protein